MMTNKKKCRCTCFLVIMSLCLFIFSSNTFAGEPGYGGTLRIGVRVPQFKGLDIRYPSITTSVPTATFVYDPTLIWGERGFESLEPGLATSVETKDNKVWIIHLRKGVKFHHGREMTAEDIMANFDWRITTPKGWKPVKYKQLIKYLKKAEVIDKYTVKITLEKPYSTFYRIQARCLRGIAPVDEVEKWGKTFAAHPSGTGPFKVGEIRPQEKVVLERFDEYWGPRPYLDRVEVKFYRGDESRLIALQKGEVDMAILADEARPVLEKDPNLTYKIFLAPHFLNKYYFNMRRWPMSDIRFRKAVWMGADWKNIVINSHAYKSGIHARTLFEHSKYFNPEALKLVPKYNPEEAKKLIKAVEKDAGKKIPPIFYLDSNMTSAKNMATLAKVQLAQIGVELNLQLLSMAMWFNKVQRDPKLEWDMAGYGGGFAHEAFIGLRFYETDSKTAADGKSLPGYSNPEFDQWLIKAEDAKNEEEKVKCYQEAEKILLKDAVSIPLHPVHYILAYNKKVKGVKLNDTGYIHITNPWANVWIEE